MTDFLKYKQNRKIWKVLSLGKVNWHNLLEQFPHISTTNFATLFSSENLKEKTTIFRNCNFFGQSYFLHSGNQVFAYHAYRIYLYIRKAYLHDLCMNHASLNCVSWTSTTPQEPPFLHIFSVPIILKKLNKLICFNFRLADDQKSFKACVCYFHQIFIFSPNDSPSKTMKNAFYVI